MKRLILAAAALSMLAACASTEFTTHKVAVGGLYVGPGAFGAGYVSATGTDVPFLTKDGATLFTVQNPCGNTDTPAVYSNLNANASAAASSNGTTPAVSAATGDVTATGDAARNISLGGAAGAPANAATIAAQYDCHQALPAAAAGSVTH